MSELEKRINLIELNISVLNERLDTMFLLMRNQFEKNDKQFESLWESMPLDDSEIDLGVFKGRPIC